MRWWRLREYPVAVALWSNWAVNLLVFWGGWTL
jgi:hypothetical protein